MEVLPEFPPGSEWEGQFHPERKQGLLWYMNQTGTGVVWTQRMGHVSALGDIL
jgi:hypothetical protein